VIPLKIGNENFDFEEIELIATYEEVYQIPSDKKVTEWWGDMNMHEFKNGINEEQAKEALDIALKSVKMLRGEFGEYREAYRSKLIAKMKENMPVKYDVITIFNKPVLFTNERLEVDEVPDGMFRYDMRHDEGGDFCEIGKRIGINHAGTVLAMEEIKITQENRGKICTIESGLKVEYDDYNFLSLEYTLDEYREKYDEIVAEYCKPEQNETMTMS